MAATARLIVMMEPDEKSALEARAEAANVSTAEFVRRRLRGRDEPEEQALIEVLADLKPLVRRATRTIDANLAAIRALRASAGREEASIADRSRRELDDDDRCAIADRLQLSGPRRPARRRRRRE